MTKKHPIRFWKDRSKGIVNASLFEKEAQFWAKIFGRGQRGNRNKPTQLRRFFDEVLRQQTLTQVQGVSGEDFDNILAYLNLLVARAAYAQGRGLVSREFVGFLRSCTKELKEPEDLRVYADFFEAVMAYYKEK